MYRYIAVVIRQVFTCSHCCVLDIKNKLIHEMLLICIASMFVFVYRWLKLSKCYEYIY